MADADVDETVGALGVDVVPETGQFGNRLRAATLPEAQRIGREIAARIAQPIAREVSRAVVDGVSSGARRAVVQATAAGRDIGNAMQRAIQAAMRDPVKVRVDTSQAMADIARVAAALRALKSSVNTDVTTDTGGALAEIAALQKALRALTGARLDIAVDSGTSLTEIASVATAVGKLRGADIAITVDVDEALRNVAEVAAAVKALSDTRIAIDVDTGSAGASLAALAVSIRAVSALANITVSVDIAGALTEVASLESALAGLQHATAIPPLAMDVEGALGKLTEIKTAMSAIEATSIDIDVDVTGALAKIAALKAALDGLTSTTTLSVRVTMPNAEAVGRRIGREAGREFYEAFRRTVTTSPPVVPPVQSPTQSRAEGSERGGAYARGFRTTVQEIMRTLPNPRLSLERGPNFNTELRAIQRELAELNSLTVGVDIDERVALERLNNVETRLHSISQRARQGSQLNLDTDAAERALRAYREQLNNSGPDPAVAAAQGARAGGAFGRAYAAGVNDAASQIRRVEIDGDTDPITRDIEFVRRRLEFLGTQRIGIDIDAADAMAEARRLEAELIRLGSMTPSIEVEADTAAAHARLGAMMAAIEALSRNEVDVDVDVDDHGGFARIMASALLTQVALSGVGAAGLSSMLILIPVAAAAAAAVGAIAVAALAGIAALGVIAIAMVPIMGAVQAITAAQDEAGKGAAQSVARANAMASAADGVKNAQRGLAAAQKDAQRAQEGLTEARKEEKRALEDLNASIKANHLSQRQAALDLKEAEAERRKVLADSGSTADQREQADINYERAKLRVEELATQQRRLGEERAKADRVGIEGSDRVRAAHERVAASNERVAAAQQQLAAAQRQQAVAAQTAATSGSSAADKMRESLAKLTPEGRAFAFFLVGLKKEWEQLSGAAQRTFLPGLQAGIGALLPVLPMIVVFIERFGTSLGKMAEQAGKALASPFFIQFFDWLGTQGVRVLENFAKAGGHLLIGILALVQAFGPFAEEFSAGLLQMARDFSTWAASVSQSQGFRDFMDYVRAEGPKIVGLLLDLGVVLLKLAIALAPLASIVLTGLVLFFDWLARQNPGVILAIAAAVAVLVAVVAAGPGTIAVAVVAVIGLLVWLYREFEGFRNVVDTVAKAVATAAIWLWQNVLQPTFASMGNFLTNQVGPAFVWLWENAIKPAWNGISTAAVWLWNTILKPIFEALVWFVSTVVGPTFTNLWQWFVKPAWEGIKVIIDIAWAAIQVTFGLIQIAIKILAGIFMWLYEHAVKPSFEGIRTAISIVWNTFLKPLFQEFGAFIEAHVAPAFQRGVSTLGRIWHGLQNMAAVPVRFVIEDVLNNGLLAAYNWVAKKFGVKPDNVRIDLPGWAQQKDLGSSTQGYRGYAEGGVVWGKGTGTSDDILARLSNGEYVIPAHIVRTFGVEFFDWLIGRRNSHGDNQRPGDGSEGLAFARGGLVGWLEDTWKSLTDPVAALKDKALGLISGVPGGAWMKDVLGGGIKDTINKVISYVQEKITNLMSSDGYQGPISADVAAVQGWLRAQNGKPYIWASAGPQGYDCSGIVSAVYNMLHGKNPYQHTFSTHYQASYFPKRNQVGILTSGWANVGEQGGGSVGHTAANLAGIPFESRGSRGVIVGSEARPYTGFAHWGTFDSGGWLMPGLTYAVNETGKPEAVLTSEQWSALTNSRAGGDVHYSTVVNTQKADLSLADLAAYQARQEAQARIRRQD